MRFAEIIEAHQDRNPTHLPRQKRALRRGLAKRNMICARHFLLNTLLQADLTDKERFQMRKAFIIISDSLVEFQQGTTKLGYKQKTLNVEDQI